MKGSPEGGSARARKYVQVVLAACADETGYLNGTSIENARALMAAREAKRKPMELDGDLLDERTVASVLKRASKRLFDSE